MTQYLIIALVFSSNKIEDEKIDPNGNDDNNEAKSDNGNNVKDVDNFK